jgi:hypothetical protein
VTYKRKNKLKGPINDLKSMRELLINNSLIIAKKNIPSDARRLVDGKK